MSVAAIAAPVMERLPDETPAFEVGQVELEDGFVVLVTPPGTPWMPNAIALGPGPPVVWDPVVPAVAAGGPLAARGVAILFALGVERLSALADALSGAGATRPPAGAVDALLDALAADDAAAAGRAARALAGAGAGLTPEGDDLVAGAWVTAAATGVALPLPADLRALTTPLSATLLELAAGGAAPRPVHGLLDLANEGWRGALAELEGLGASSGRAIALGAGAAAALLGTRAGAGLRGAPPRAARH